MSLKQIFCLKSKQDQAETVQKYNIHGVNVNVVPSEKPFADKLFDSLASIPTGQNAIEDMKKYKVDFFLETALGTAGGYFSPEENKIVMAKSLGMDFMEFALVHEARHLLQNNLGRNEAESQNLDYASRLMINRATEADAQTQAIKACKEWEAQGHEAPLKRFTKHYPPIVKAYNQDQSLSDAFKGWYAHDRIGASYEQGYDVIPCLSRLGKSFDSRTPVSLQPADIAKFCGADRVEGFEDFMQSKQARQVHLLTKTIVELYDATVTARGGKPDQSLEQVPVRDLRSNIAAQSCAKKYIRKTREDFGPKTAISPQKKAVLETVSRAVDAVEKINIAAIKGGRDLVAEKELQAEKEQIKSDIKKPSKRNIKQILAAKTTQGRG